VYLSYNEDHIEDAGLKTNACARSNYLCLKRPTTPGRIFSSITLRSPLGQIPRYISTKQKDDVNLHENISDKHIFNDYINSVFISSGCRHRTTNWTKDVGEVAYNKNHIVSYRCNRGFHPTQRTQPTQRKERNVKTPLLDKPATTAYASGTYAAKLWQTNAIWNYWN